MKKGKTCKLNGFTRLKSTYGTVDSKTFKSLYLNIQSWVTPQKSVENWSRVVNILNREIKETINEILDSTLLQPKFILELGARLIKTETELILKSRFVVPTRLLEANFNFKFSDIEMCLASLR